MTTTQKNKQTGTAGQNTAQTQAMGGQFEVGTIVHVAPESLLMTKNIRDAKASPDLVKSIASVGILQPVVAVTTTDTKGAPALLVRFGHRRTLAAIEAKVTVPAYIAGADGEAKTDEVLRVIAQRDENTHRDGLTAADDLHVVETLTGLGLTAAQVTKQARIKRADVNAALAVSESKLARAATERYESLTLDQAAVVAEFEDDTETAKALIIAAKEGQFDHVAQRARRDRDKARMQAEVTAALAEAGVPIVERPGYDDKNVKALTALAVSAEDRTRLHDTDHTGCPGHVAWISLEWVTVGPDGSPVVTPDEPDVDEPDAPYDLDEFYEYEDGEDDDAPDPRASVDPDVLAAYDAAVAEYEKAWEDHRAQVAKAEAGARRVQQAIAVYGCKGWRTHGHHDPYSYGSSSGTKPKAADMTDAEREKAKKARKLVIDNNKAWTTALDVRREYLATLAKAKTPPKGTQKFLANALLADAGLIGDYTAKALAQDWLGYNATTNITASIDKGTDNRALVIALIRLLAAYEAPLGGQFGRMEWRRDGTRNATGRYLRFLQSTGYALSDVEKFTISKKTA